MRTMTALILREMATRYGRNPGGYVWALLEPLGVIVILSFGFALMLRAPPLGNAFLLFYATGYLPFVMFQKTARMVMNALNFSRALLRYPAVTWIDTVFARAVLNILTDLLVAYILLGAILIVLETAVTLDFVPIIVGFAMMALLGTGVGLLNCAVQGLFPVWGTIWGVVTRPLMLASAVLWIWRDLPPMAQDILWWNPLIHAVALVRSGFYATFDPYHVSSLYVLGFGMGTMALGLLLLRRHHLEILSRR